MLFVSFAMSTVVFALVCGLVFSMFWIGIATLLLVPTLLVTFSVAVLVWVWAVATFLFARRIYNMIPASVRGHMAVRLPGSDGRQIVVQKKGGDAGANGAGNKNYSRNTNGGVGEELGGRERGFSFDDVDVKSEATEANQ